MRTDYKNWRLHLDGEQLLWLNLDKANASANTLNVEIFEELNQILDDIKATPNIKGVIIRSAKGSGFIAGADIEQFTKLDSVESAMKLIRRGQMLFDKLAALPMPTVAVIDGFCLGGGMELALACRYRIAENSDKTRLGLPEIMLGFHPGWGGTVRLPRLVGALKAMDLILSGRRVSGKTAKKMGIVDAAVARRYLEDAAKYYALKDPGAHKPSFLEALTNKAWVRPLIAKLLRQKIAKKVRQNQYPAPYKVIECWAKAGVEGDAAMLAEAQSVSSLQQSVTAQNLVRIFFLQDRLKSLGKNTAFHVKHVHVVGAGVMGGDIAAWCALRGLRVTLQDREPKFIAPAIKRAHDLFKSKLKDRLLVQDAMDRLLPDPQANGVAEADVIIEAIFENLEAKQALFKELESKAKPSAILASNTSSIPLDEINTALKQPERLVGIHFFNPVPKMMLVEVVHGDKTSNEVVEKAMAFVHKIDKLPLPVKSMPGFLVNRVLTPYMMECIMLLNEGHSKESIDEAAVRFGMPMGPVELADTVGLDICLSVAKNLTRHFGGEVPEKLVSMVKEGKLGRKSGAGFYTYQNGKAVKKPIKSKAIDEKITQRLVYRLLNESAACLRENVVKDSDLLDAGMIFGTGFAPFRGGPMQYARTEGKEKVLAIFQELQASCGVRYKPDAEWTTFYQ